MPIETKQEDATKRTDEILPVVGWSRSMKFTGCGRFRLPIDCETFQNFAGSFFSVEDEERWAPGWARLGGRGDSESFLRWTKRHIGIRSEIFNELDGIG